MDSAALIKQARIRNGLSQAELARRAGTSQPVISAYEHGLRDPTTATLTRILQAAGERVVLTLARRAEPGSTPPTPLARSAALLDVLLLADAIPRRRPVGPLRMPRIDSARARR